jgi:hypothetical protein
MVRCFLCLVSEAEEYKDVKGVRGMELNFLFIGEVSKASNMQ